MKIKWGNSVVWYTQAAPAMHLGCVLGVEEATWKVADPGCFGGCYHCVVHAGCACNIPGLVCPVYYLNAECLAFTVVMTMTILDTFRLDGRVALVTGVGRGLGRAMAVALAQAGADIAGLYLNNYAATETAVNENGCRFYPIQCDLQNATHDDLNGIIAMVKVELGRLDVLVNNAGIIRRAPAVEYSAEDWQAVIQVNLNALFFLSQAAGRVMVTQGRGKIINVASMLSYQGGVFVPAYTAAKSAVAGLTKALANEWAAVGVQVNAIAPGYMETDNTAPLRADVSRNEAIVARIPAGHWGKPEDLAGITVFLASSASDYVNGAIIPVDGGWLAR